MLLTKPFEEEFALGHLGRVCQLNPQFNRARLLAEIREKLPDSDRTAGVGKLLYLSAASHLPLSKYATKHTLLPFAWFVRERAVTGAKLTVRALEDAGLKSRRDPAFFCPECANDDASHQAVSYWRRAHQLKGVYWCHSHPRVALMAVADRDAFLHAPAYWLRKHKAARPKDLNEFDLHPLVRQYGDMALSMLISGLTFDKATIERCLCEHADRHQAARSSQSVPLRTSNGPGAQYLPRSFSSEIFRPTPDLLRLWHLHDMPVFVRNERTTGKSRNLALALAILFQEAERAFVALSAAERELAMFQHAATA